MKLGILAVLIAFVFAFGCAEKGVTEEEAKGIAEMEAQKLGIESGFSEERRDMAVDLIVGNGYKSYGFVVNETYDCKRILFVSGKSGNAEISWRCTPQGKDWPQHILKEIS